MAVFPPDDTFVRRHIGPDGKQVEQMLAALGAASLDDLVSEVVPPSIRLNQPLALPAARSETEVLEALAAMAAQNEVWRSYLGYGFHDTITPPVVLRNIV